MPVAAPMAVGLKVTDAVQDSLGLSPKLQCVASTAKRPVATATSSLPGTSIPTRISLWLGLVKVKVCTELTLPTASAPKL